MKLKYLLLSCFLLLASCNGNDSSKLNIVCPTGAPSVAFYNYAKNNQFTTNGKPENIIAMMTQSSNKDIVVIDTVSGIQAINAGSPYKIASTITFGNFYIASTGNDENTIMDEGDSIILFGQGKTPDLLFHYLYGDLFDSSIEYVGNVQDAAKCLASGKNQITGHSVDYVFIAQPALYTVLNNQTALTYGKSSVYVNIQEEYVVKSNNLPLMQASVFVKDGSDKSLVNDFLTSLEKDINDALINPNLVIDGMNAISDEEISLVYGINKNAAKYTLENGNTIGLGYKQAYSYKSAIDNYISLFGVGETNEEIYYR
jgi:hypothetical protein